MSAPGTIANLEKLLGGPRDNALLRYSLGNEYLRAGDCARAAQMLRSSLGQDPQFSAAWKLLGKALEACGGTQDALSAYRSGIEVAEARGDIQAAKEMRVFAKRIEKSLPPQR